MKRITLVLDFNVSFCNQQHLYIVSLSRAQQGKNKVVQASIILKANPTGTVMVCRRASVENPRSGVGLVPLMWEAVSGCLLAKIP